MSRGVEGVRVGVPGESCKVLEVPPAVTVEVEGVVGVVEGTTTLGVGAGRTGVEVGVITSGIGVVCEKGGVGMGGED